MQDDKSDFRRRSSRAETIILSAILLVLLAASVATYIWRVDAHKILAVEDQNPVITWVQRSDVSPQGNNAVFEFAETPAVPIMSKHWDFDYWPIEMIIKAIKVNAAEQLILDDGMAGILLSIMSSLPGDLNPENLFRLQTLIKKNIPGVAGQEFSDLVLNYYRYHEVLQSWNETQNSTELSNTSEERFRQSLKIMDEWIGENKRRAIFARQHALSEYLFQRRRINANTSLSQAEKKSILSELEKDFSESQK